MVLLLFSALRLSATEKIMMMQRLKTKIAENLSIFFCVKKNINLSYEGQLRGESLKVS